MAFDGSGTFNRPVSSYVSGTVIDETSVNSEFDGIATGLSNCITKDGQTTPTANIPMASKKFTSLTVGSASTDSVHLGQVQASAYSWCSTAGGTADALTLTPAPAIAAYAAGQTFRFIAASNNTTAATINVSSLGTKAIESNGAALTADDIVAGQLYEVFYDGTAFQIGLVAALGGATQAQAEAGTNNVKLMTPLRTAQAVAALAFPATTKMLFAQDTAPTGWTKVTTAGLDQSALRLVTTTTFTTGGTDTFSTCFSSSKATESHTLTTDEIPSHTHSYSVMAAGSGGVEAQSGTSIHNVGGTTGSAGGGSGHSHDITLDPLFQDVIMATKD